MRRKEDSLPADAHPQSHCPRYRVRIVGVTDCEFSLEVWLDIALLQSQHLLWRRCKLAYLFENFLELELLIRRQNFWATFL
jgi:hypothetical protein